jgi:putative transposase
MQRPRQLELVISTWGGRRRGAGRKPAPGRRTVPHRSRGAHLTRCPAHVTLRAARGLPSLRDGRVFVAIRTALAASSQRPFRLLHYSVQADHVHLLVEADAPLRLVRGIQGLAIRVAKAINRVLARTGCVWGDRYHARTLKTPREVRNALVYVLNNFRKHVRNVPGIDPFSSAAWFPGWATEVRAVLGRSPVAEPRTWLARVGWMKHGRISVHEAPRGAP